MTPASSLSCRTGSLLHLSCSAALLVSGVVLFIIQGIDHRFSYICMGLGGGSTFLLLSHFLHVESPLAPPNPLPLQEPSLTIPTLEESLSGDIRSHINKIRQSGIKCEVMESLAGKKSLGSGYQGEVFALSEEEVVKTLNGKISPNLALKKALVLKNLPEDMAVSRFTKMVYIIERDEWAFCYQRIRGWTIEDTTFLAKYSADRKLRFFLNRLIPIGKTLHYFQKMEYYHNDVALSNIMRYGNASTFVLIDFDSFSAKKENSDYRLFIGVFRALIKVAYLDEKKWHPENPNSSAQEEMANLLNCAPFKEFSEIFERGSELPWEETIRRMEAMESYIVRQLENL